MGEVVIRFDRFTLERTIYWLVIIVLGVFLILAHLGDDVKDETKTANENTETTQDTAQEVEEALEVETEEIIPEVEETCSDNIRNQDETAVDCGGICADSNGEYFYNNECHDNPEPEEQPGLSGSIDFSVKNVDVLEASSGAIKVEGFQVTIENGKEDNLFSQVGAYAKSNSGIYLNQFGDALDDYSYYIPIIDIEKIESGESKTITISESGSYIFEQSGYSLGDDFKLVVVLYDDNGDKIDEVSKTVRG